MFSEAVWRSAVGKVLRSSAFVQIKQFDHVDAKRPSDDQSHWLKPSASPQQIRHNEII